MRSKRTDSRGNPFGVKWTTRNGFWNIRMLREYGKLKQVEKEMTNYKLDVMGLSEIRWKESGEIITQNGNSLIFSGVGEDKEHRNGVGVLMNKEARKSLMEWSLISERIMAACFKTKICNLTVIQCYAPTEITEKDKKEEFYQQLSETINTVKQRDVIIVMGDMNAKIGPNNEHMGHVMGRHGFGNMNENGELFSELCAKYDLIIG